MKDTPKKIFVFTHPDFLNIKSIDRYSNWIVNGLKEKGYDAFLIKPNSILSAILNNKGIKKYLGYLDLFILFPFKINSIVRKNKYDSLFVLADQALGPWAKYFPQKKLIIHCHDFLAQLSALDRFPQNVLSKSGKIYQQYIRKGYSKCENFICISENTQNDLLIFLPNKKYNISVVYNGVAPVFKDETLKHKSIEKDFKYILHVGGNQWYKNRIGVIESYIRFSKKFPNLELKLILIGESMTFDQLKLLKDSSLEDNVIIKQNISDQQLIEYYSAAELLLFPSIAEGFGWPVAEAMTCGQLVITTNKAPLTEVGGNAAFYVPEYSSNLFWTELVSDKIFEILKLPKSVRMEIINLGKRQAMKFDSQISLSKIEEFYIETYNLNK